MSVENYQWELSYLKYVPNVTNEYYFTLLLSYMELYIIGLFVDIQVSINLVIWKTQSDIKNASTEITFMNEISQFTHAHLFRIRT